MTSPSGSLRPSLTITFKSEPSGFADNTRPAPRSRKKSRPEVVVFFAFAPDCDDVVVLMKNISLLNRISKLLEANLRTTAQEFCQDLVLLCSKLLDGAATCNSHHFVRYRLLQVRRNVWCTEDLHHPLEGAHEVFHKMVDPARPSAEVPLKARSHHPPPRPRPIAHGDIGVRDAQYALLNEIEDLLVDRRLQPI